MIVGETPVWLRVTVPVRAMNDPELVNKFVSVRSKTVVPPLLDASSVPVGAIESTRVVVAPPRPMLPEMIKSAALTVPLAIVRDLPAPCISTIMLAFPKTSVPDWVMLKLPRSERVIGLEASQVCVPVVKAPLFTVRLLVTEKLSAKEVVALAGEASDDVSVKL